MKKKSTLVLPHVILTKARIKKISRINPNIGKLSSSTPCVISKRYSAKATEIFIEELITKAGKFAADRKDTKVSSWHVSEALNNDSSFRGLKSHFQDVLATVGSEPPQPKKRTQKKKTPAKTEISESDELEKAKE